MAQPAKDELLAAIRKYRELDDSIKKINKGLTDLRDERGEVEQRMGEILMKPEFASFHKMELSDQSYIRVQRPGEWNKPWSLSKKELQVLLAQFFASPQPKTAEDCFKFIADERAKALVGTDAHFTRLERI